MRLNKKHLIVSIISCSILDLDLKLAKTILELSFFIKKNISEQIKLGIFQNELM